MFTICFSSILLNLAKICIIKLKFSIVYVNHIWL